jgi:hypothetical protein
VIYPGSTPVGNATLVVANVLTCNKHSPTRPAPDHTIMLWRALFAQSRFSALHANCWSASCLYCQLLCGSARCWRQQASAHTLWAYPACVKLSGLHCASVARLPECSALFTLRNFLTVNLTASTGSAGLAASNVCNKTSQVMHKTSLEACCKQCSILMTT